MNRAVRIGNEGEQFVISFFNQNGIETKKEEDFDKRYDHDIVCKLGRKKFTCEIKFDSMACKTGNLAIEYHNSKKDEPSGISATKADIWIHLIKDGDNIAMFAVKTDKLKEFIKNNPPFKTVSKAGQMNAELNLWKLDDILPTFERLEDLPESDFQKTVKKILKGE